MNAFIPDPPTPVSEPASGPPAAVANASAEAGAPKPQPRVWFEIVAVLGFTMIPSIWFSFEELLRPRTYDSTLSSNLRWVATYALQSYAVLYFVRLADIPFSRIGIVRPKWSDLVIAFAILVIHFGVNGVLHRVIPRIYGIEARPPMADPFASATFVLYFAWRLVIAFFEELVARGYLITRIWDASGSPLAALLLSSLLFGASHAYQGTHAIVYKTVTGLIYGLGFILCRRIWPVALVHAFWNLVVVGRQ